MCFSDRLSRNLALNSYRHRLVGSGEMRNFLAEHSGSGAFDPNEVDTLVAAFDKAWEAVQASGVVYPEAKAEAARAILAKHIIAAAMHGERDHARLRDGALLALAQSNLRTAPDPLR
jgi:hypothetical protein